MDPTIQALNINASPVIVASIGATTEDGLAAVAEIARTEVVPEISALEGVSRADLTGGLEQRLVITLDPVKLADSGVSVAQISGVLTANNLTFPSGQVSADGTSIPVSTIGSLTSPEQIAGLVVGFRGVAAPAGPAAPASPPAPAASGDPAASAAPWPRPRPPPRPRSRSPTSAPSSPSTSRPPATPAPTATRRCR